MRTAALDGAALRRRFPFLDADLARIDLDGGVVDVPAVTRALTGALRERGVALLEGVAPSAIVRDGARFRVLAGAGELGAGALVVTAGHGTNQVLSLLPGRTLRVPITKDRPSEAKYLTPPGAVRDLFVAGAMPTIAYLDTGIYCHPIVDGLVDAVKIGYYNPPDLPRSATVIDSIATFVEQCLPGLQGATVRDVEDVDQCDYDLVADDEFVLGPVADVAGAFVGVGWRGTGYKFAPWVGLVLAELALKGATAYDIARFDPARFQQGGVIDAPSIAQDAAAASR
jgi:sarcosine oxidase